MKYLIPILAHPLDAPSPATGGDAMTHAEELSKIAARLAEIAKEMAPQPVPSKICAIGEKKMIQGSLYVKRDSKALCIGCAFYNTDCPGEQQDPSLAIEDGGSECEGTIWKRCRK